jgi:hypothetical protein
MTSTPHLPLGEGYARTLDALVSVVSDGTVLLGTIDTLARAMGVSVADLRSGVRELLEAELITVNLEPRRQISIRLDRRRILPVDRPI